MKTWDELKSKGSEHYKTGGTEPVDLYVAGNMFHDFALCSIMKYAFRSRREMNLETDLLIKNLEKIIDYAQKLIAGLKTTKVDATLINPENNANGPEETKNPLTHFFGIGYQYRFSNQFSFGVEAKQNYFHSDRVDGYNPVIRANKHRDEAFDLKLTAAYYFPFSRRMSEFNNRWDRRQRR